MRMSWIGPRRPALLLGGVLLAATTGLALLGCGGGASLFNLYGGLFDEVGGASGSSGATVGIGSGGSGISSGGSGNDRTPVNPCNLNESSKYVRISMRNQNELDYIHYFVIFVAYVYEANVGDSEGVRGVYGAVCPDDKQLYRSNGYELEVADGEDLVIGNYCIEGPAMVQFYENGRFRRTSGSGNELASAIAPASGSVPTYDLDFSTVGARIPVPNIILWHNPGTGEGAALKFSENARDACRDPNDASADPDCFQDAFYYVNENDQPSGSPILGSNSYRRVPSEIQGTLCRSGLSRASQNLAPANITGEFARDYEFFRGGRIDYVFIRQDLEPPIPQLLWKVTDSRGGVAHTFDPRADIN